MKAKLWAIKGPKKFLEIMYKDLGDVGYDTYTHISRLESQEGVICNNIVMDTNDKESYKILYNGSSIAFSDLYRTFTLPKEYDEALTFAKAQLDDSLWTEKKKEETIPEYIKCICWVGDMFTKGKIHIANFKPSTKEAYDKQQQVPKFKEEKEIGKITRINYVFTYYENGNKLTHSSHYDIEI